MRSPTARVSFCEGAIERCASARAAIISAVVQGWKVASITDRGVTVVDAYGREAKIELPDPLAKNPRAR